MSEFNITLSGKLLSFVGGDTDSYYIGETEVFFSTKDQAVTTPVNTKLSLSVNDKHQVYPGDGYYVLT